MVREVLRYLHDTIGYVSGASLMRPVSGSHRSQFGRDVGHHGGPSEISGRDGVDVDSVGSIVACDLSGQVDDRALGCAVGGFRRSADETVDGGDLNDGATRATSTFIALSTTNGGDGRTRLGRISGTKRNGSGYVVEAVKISFKIGREGDGFLRHHLLNGKLGTQPETFDIDRHDLFERFDRLVFDASTEGGDTRVVHENVQTSAAEGDTLFDGGLELRLGGDVERLEFGVAAQALDQFMSRDVAGALGRDLAGTEGLRLQIGAKDAGTSSSKVKCSLSTNAGRGAGNEDSTTRKAERRRKRLCKFGEGHGSERREDGGEPDR